MRTMSNDFRLAVLNPGGRDAVQAFPDFAGPVDDRVHAPVNYHAYAACTGGSFQHDAARIAKEQVAVLVLLRRDLRPALEAVKHLKRRGHVVAISWKESGLHQVAKQLEKGGMFGHFREICGLAHGALSSTPDLVPFYEAAGAHHVEFIPTPYPVDDERWNFARPWSKRAGILIGTREFDLPSRNHLAALLAAKQLHTSVTVFNPDGRAAARRLAELKIPHLHVIERRLPYSDYLREVARHRLVLQFDKSGVPGQVAGDALLCRVPCVGGDGAIERVAFPKLCSHGHSHGDCLHHAARLLADETLAQHAVADTEALAEKQLSFAAGAHKLAAFFRKLSA